MPNHVVKSMAARVRIQYQRGNAGRGKSYNPARGFARPQERGCGDEREEDTVDRGGPPRIDVNVIEEPQPLGRIDRHCHGLRVTRSTIAVRIARAAKRRVIRRAVPADFHQVVSISKKSGSV